MLYQTVGANVKRCRLSKNLTQQDLAHRSSMCEKCISTIECGKSNITIDTLESISKALGVHPAWLVTEEE